MSAPRISLHDIRTLEEAYSCTINYQGYWQITGPINPTEKTEVVCWLNWLINKRDTTPVAHLENIQIRNH